MEELVQTKEFKNILAFCVLMGGREVIEKSPDYIVEKYNRYVGSNIPNENYPWGLDSNNTRIFEEYLDKWRKV